MTVPAWLLTLTDLLSWVSQLSILVPMFLVFRHRHTFSSPLRILSLYVFLSLASSLAMRAGAYFFYQNHPVSHTYTLLKTLLFGWVYYTAVRQLLWKQVVAVLLGAYVIFAIVDATQLTGLFHFNSYGRAVQSTLLIGLALAYIEQLLNSIRTAPLEHDPLFLVSIGLILFSAGTVVLFLYSTQLDYVTSTLAFNLVMLLNLVFNVFLTLAFRRESQRHSVDRRLEPVFF